MIYLDKGKEIIKKINNHGYEAYIVGGAVRDYLLNVDVHDIDITTNMPMEKLAGLFDTLNGTGVLYESLTIMYEDEEFEITHFRKESGYLDHRHPIVELTDSLDEDLIRRDFTINALAMDYDGNIIDKFNGLADLDAKLIRTIGNPTKRFTEDALRILRACYFAGKLNFEIEEETQNAIKELANTLINLSKERIYEYFIRIAETDKGNAKHYLKKLQVFSELPDWQRWLYTLDSSEVITDLGLYYWKDHQDYPPYYLTTDKKYFKAIDELINNNYDNYSLFKTYEYKEKLIPIFKGLNLGKKYAELAIKNAKELALTQEEIAAKFDGSKKAKAIEMVIRAILDKKIKNDTKEILDYLNGVVY